MNPSTSQTVKIKNVSSNAEILNKTCPEIFETSPRPGGFLKVMVPTRSQDYMADSCPCGSVTPKKSTMSVASSRYDRPSAAPGLNLTTASTTSREFRLKRAIEETDWELTAVDETDTVVGISNVLHDTVNMLAVSISCVMLMAADLKVPEDYLIWAQSYLQCIKDDEGLNPPNIQGIINEIIKRRDPNYSPSGTLTEGKKKGGTQSPVKERSSKSLARESSGSKHKSATNHDRDAETNMATLEAQKPNPPDGTDMLVAVEYGKRHNMTLEFVVDEENEWGDVYANWTGRGVLGNLVQDKGDVGIGALYSWKESFDFFDFSKPVMRTGVTCIAPAPRLASGLSTPFAPFSLKLWIITAIAYILASASMFIILSISDAENNQNNPKVQNVEMSFELSGRIFLLQSFQKVPNLEQSRITFGLALILSLLLNTMYSSGLSSTMTIPKYYGTIHDVNDLVASGMNWGATSTAWISSIESDSRV